MAVSTPVASIVPNFSAPPAASKYIGAHISASGGCLNAIENAVKYLGPHARSFAFFIRPRMSWRAVPPIVDDVAQAFQDSLQTTSHGQFTSDKIVVHGAYILNFGSHDEELRQKSIELMIEEVSKCQQLGIRWYVFHPGSCTRVPEHLAWSKPPKNRNPSTKKRKSSTVMDRTTVDEVEIQAYVAEQLALESQARTLSLQYISECMYEVIRRTEDSNVVLCVENMCGQGNVLGRNFDELRMILDRVVQVTTNNGCTVDEIHSRLGICLDTCHLWSSGYKLSTVDDCEFMIAGFYATMGDRWRDVLKAVHVNDSMDPCGSRKDRHENLGFGQIGLTAFEWLMNSSHFDNLPLIVETPRRAQAFHDARIQKLSESSSLISQEHQTLLSTTHNTDANELELLTKLVRPEPNIHNPESRKEKILLEKHKS